MKMIFMGLYFYNAFVGVMGGWISDFLYYFVKVKKVCPSIFLRHSFN